MNATEIVDKILADASAEAEKITGQAKADDDAVNAQFNATMSAYKAETEVLAQKAAAEKKSRILAASRMSIAKELLFEKKRILDSVFDEARQKLKSMSDVDYQEMMKKLMLKAVETGDEEVITDANDSRMDQKFVKNINRELGPGFKGNLRLSERHEVIEAGFILKRGHIMNNASLDVLISQVRKDMEIKLAKELFEN